MSEETTQVPQPKNGDHVHLEIPVKDPARAKAFYGDVFGWTFTDVPEIEYILFQTPGKGGGGFYKPAEGQPTIPVNYFAVASIDESAKQVVALGGKLLTPKTDIGEHGWFQHVEDSEGNLISLWQGK